MYEKEKTQSRVSVPLRHFTEKSFLNTYICKYMHKYVKICSLWHSLVAWLVPQYIHVCTVVCKNMQCFNAIYAEICSIYAVYMQIYRLYAKNVIF